MKALYLIPLLAACTDLLPPDTPVEMAAVVVEESDAAAVAPAPAPPAPPPPPPTARTVEQFDTTTREDRAEALAKPEPAGEQNLGTSIASLGNPADPGIWLVTPLVSETKPGRIEWRGNSVNVELRPSGGAAGSGSEISLAAMRLLEAPLTDLPEITVFAN